MFRINFLWGISLTVFNSHHSTFKAKKRIKLTYSSAKVLRVLNEKTRSSRSGFEKNLPCAINLRDAYQTMRTVWDSQHAGDRLVTKIWDERRLVWSACGTV